MARHKRVAKGQLTKHNMDKSDGGSGSEGDEDFSQNSQPSEIAQRQISQPKYRLGSQDSKTNTLAALLNKQKKEAESAKEKPNPWIKVRGLNASFAKSIQSEIEKDPLTDLSKLFQQYVKYWDQLSKANPTEIKLPAGALKSEETSKAASLFNFTAPEAPPKPIEPIKPFTFTAPMAPAQPAAPVLAPFKFPEPAKEAASQEEKNPSLSAFTFQPATPAAPAPAETKPAFSFSFGAPQPMATPFGLLSPGQSQSQPSKEGEGSATAADDEPLEPAKIGLIRTGAGEEGEECIAEARVKLFVFNKDDNSWVDLGVGFFKVNKRTDGATDEKPNRILCRSEVSGTILLNSAIVKDATKTDLEPGKSIIKLTCINQEGKLATYSVRTKEAQIAKSLVDAVSSLL